MKPLKYYMSLQYQVLLEKISEPDGAYYKLSVPRLPGLAAYGDDLAEAEKELEASKEVWFKTCLKDGIEIPEPVDESFSGRITLRMPKSLHKELTVLAKEENVSLNQYVVALLEHNTANEMRSVMNGKHQ